VSSLVLSSPGAIAIQFGQVTIRWYGIMIAVGFLVATWAATFLAKRRNFDVDHLINGLLATFFAGIIGARLYYVALSLDRFLTHPQEIFATWLGGLSIHGGIVGGLIGGWIYCRIAKVPFITGLDIAASVVPLAQAIGRWGNFFNSEAFGRPTADDFPLKLYIPPAMRPHDFINYDYFHPTFLYESVWNLLIFLILYFVTFERVKNYPGMQFLLYLFLYSIGRFLIEPMRTDSIMVGNLPAPYVVSGLLIAASGVAIIFRYTSVKHKT
jgi:phosphatidylglycerol---prolipoprotein diacylglyceryl transferase